MLFIRKSNVVRILNGQRVGVIGAIDRNTKEVKLRLSIRRRQVDCINFIVDSVVQNTTVITDLWRGYNNLSSFGFNHLTVNHSINFVNPIDHTVHTNRIERLWRSLKNAQGIIIISKILKSKLKFSKYFIHLKLKKQMKNMSCC